MIGGSSLSSHRHCRVIVTMRSVVASSAAVVVKREDNVVDDDDNGMVTAVVVVVPVPVPVPVPGASDGDGPLIICAGDDEYYYTRVCCRCVLPIRATWVGVNRLATLVFFEPHTLYTL